MSKWDNAIDEVARHMTETPPDAGFKARVLAKIDTSDRRPLRMPVWKWALPAVATLAVLILSIARVQWKAHEATPSVRSVTSDGEVRLKPDTTSDLHPNITNDGVHLKADTTHDSHPYVASAFRRTSPVSTIARAGVSRTGRAVDQLNALAPPALEIEPIGIDSMETTDSIQVPTLGVTALEVPALASE